MSSSIELAKFKPGTTFEKTIIEIRDNSMKSIASASMNLSALTFFDENIERLSMNSRNEVAKFETGPTFENSINDIKHNHLKTTDSTSMNISAITFFANNFKQLNI